jgi:hypothetical protein
VNKSDFENLTLRKALSVLWSVLGDDARDALEQMETPQPARSPKYDTRLRTKGGLVYASECDLSQLKYYHDRACKPPMDEKYRDKQEKEAKALSFFIAWRSENPEARWVGERYQQGEVKAAAPSSRPRVTDWDDNSLAPEPGQQQHQEHPYGDENEPLPF